MKNDQDLQIAKEIAKRVCLAGGTAYFVGGYVRDQILGRKNKDVDLEIHGITAEQLYSILKEVGEPIIMGNSFGIYNLRHYGLDIALPQKEKDNGRGHRDFLQFVDPFVGTKKAALRRDLTINALMQDVLTGQIIDHFAGMDDLEKGAIRHVNPDTFTEDPLRVLRAAQFAARFRFSVAEETISLCKTLSLENIPRERVWGELEKALLKSEQPSIFFETLCKMHQLSVWFPEVENLIGVEQDPVHHPEGDVWNHTMLVLDTAAALRDQATYPLGFMLAALCHDFGKTVATTCVKGRIHSYNHETEGVSITKAFLFRLTNETKLNNYVLNMVQLHMCPNLMAAQKSSTKSMCKLFDSSMSAEDLLLLAKADHCSRPGASSYSETEQFLAHNLAIFRKRMSSPYVAGADLVAAGFTPGKDFKEALAYAHKLRLAGENKENALKHTVAYINNLRRETQK